MRRETLVHEFNLKHSQKYHLPSWLQQYLLLSQPVNAIAEALQNPIRKSKGTDFSGPLDNRSDLKPFKRRIGFRLSISCASVCVDVSALEIESLVDFSS